jgi:hypothetical protein
VNRRGALLGPEGSGLSQQEFRFLGVWDCFFWVTDAWIFADRCVSGGWGRLSPNRWCGCLVLGVLFPWGGVFICQVVVWGWFSCPYFENCIVDASIFVA